MQYGASRADPLEIDRYGIQAFHTSYGEACPLAALLPSPRLVYEEADPLPIEAPVGERDVGIFFATPDLSEAAERNLIRASRTVTGGL